MHENSTGYKIHPSKHRREIESRWRAQIVNMKMACTIIIIFWIQGTVSIAGERTAFDSVLRDNSQKVEMPTPKFTRAYHIFFANKSLHNSPYVKPDAPASGELQFRTLPIEGLPKPQLDQTRSMIASFCGLLSEDVNLSPKRARLLGLRFAELLESQEQETELFYQHHLNTLSPESSTSIINIAQSLPNTETRLKVDHAAVAESTGDLAVARYQRLCENI